MTRLACLLVLALVPAATAAASAAVAPPPPAGGPPAPRLTTLGVTRTATLVSYCWGGMCADGVAGQPDHVLRWRAGGTVRLDLRLPARDVSVKAERIVTPGAASRGVVALHARRLDGTGRRWALRIPSRAGRATDLLISARFAGGDILADLGLRHRARGAR
jgi:hypothetical protein